MTVKSNFHWKPDLTTLYHYVNHTVVAVIELQVSRPMKDFKPPQPSPLQRGSKSPVQSC